MDPHFHGISDLFRQLGLPDDHASIEAFVLQHRPLPTDIKLSDADFWTNSQRTFACEEIAEDADCSVVVDDLSRLLR